MAYSAESQKRYRQKTKQFTVKFSLEELEIAQKLEEYLQDTGQSANAYLKNVIKNDLEKRGI